MSICNLTSLWQPGVHTLDSPVVGSRAHERMAISLKAKEEPLLRDFENALNEYTYPNECGAYGEFSKYLDKYREYGLTEENIFYWTNEEYARDQLVIFDPKNRWSPWRVEAQAVSRNSRFAAIHLLMRVEEITRGVSLWRTREFDNRLLPTLTTLMLVDETCKNSDEYIGKVASCYRFLKAKFGNLATAVLSRESITFLKTGICDDNPI